MTSFNTSEGSFLGFRTHSEFSAGVCDIFSSWSFIQDGREMQQANWKCTPICLNSLFCPYCLLSRQAHAIYADEAYSFYEHQRLRSANSMGGTNASQFNYNDTTHHHHDDDDENHNEASPVNRSENSRRSTTSTTTPAGRISDDDVDGTNYYQQHQQQQQQKQQQANQSTLTFATTANGTKDTGGATTRNLFGGGGGTVDDDNDYDAQNSFCPCFPKSCRTCFPRFLMYLDMTLPSSMHWSCLSAAAIDAASIGVGGAIPVTLVGVWISGLSMQALLTRHLVRRRLGLAAETLQDLVVATLFPCCAAGQQHMEMEMKRQRVGLRDFDGLVCGTWRAPPRRGAMESGIY